MRREDFEHVVRAAADAVGLDEFVIIGSQAILAEVPEPPARMVESMEVDLYPRADPARVDAVDGVLGDGSLFAQTNGYYAHGVAPGTAKAPAGWMDRLVRVEIPSVVLGENVVAHCMERHDMVLAKLVRGGERDVDYAKAALAAGLLEPGVLLARVPDLPVDEAIRRRVDKTVRALVGTEWPRD